jgi:hypothetical protein
MSIRAVGHSIMVLAVLAGSFCRLLQPVAALAEPMPEDPLGLAGPTPETAADVDVGAPVSSEPGPAPALLPEILTSSGSPLLLEILVAEPPVGLHELIVETGRSRLRFDIDSPRSLGRPDVPEPTAGQSEESSSADSLAIAVTPFLEPGVYELTVTLVGGRSAPADAGPGTAVTASYEVGFVDFVWGRDNYRFGNNRDYESRIGHYSEVLEDWLEKRFGGVGEAEHAVLVHYMYGMFGENAGRCYAFAGTQLRYYRDPGLLPRYVDTVYDIRERSTRAQREMNELQLDMVYDYFVAGGAPVAGTQSMLDVARELVRIRERIAAGSPVVTGYTSPDLHHAMLVYGYILDRARGRVDLLVANNWKSDQNLNVRSLDAEVIRVDLAGRPAGASDAASEDGEEPPLIEWRNREGPRRRAPQRMFIVPVRESYDHGRAALERLIARRFTELRETDRRLFVVENADEAWIVGDDGRITGYRDNHERSELDSVSFDRLKESVLFELPRGRELAVEFRPREGEPVRLFGATPGETAGEERGWVTLVEPEQGEVEAEMGVGTYRVEQSASGPVVRPLKPAAESAAQSAEEGSE